MKNVHILRTDKPSRLFIDDFGKLFNSINIDQEQNHFKPQHIYITSSDEEIKEGDWVITNNGLLAKVVTELTWHFINSKKIILTTDQSLDGVQAIDDTFLEWVVKNPSCEEVEVIKDLFQVNQNNPILKGSTALAEGYKIIIPKEEQKQHLIDMMKGDEELGLYEESKQETLEKAAERLYPVHKMYFPTSVEDLNKIPRSIFIDGAKWQQERMYSEEEVKHIVLEALQPFTVTVDLNQWFEQFKKKTQ